VPGIIFVFGSNLAGRHGAGAALVARELYGAQPGSGEGLIGRSFAIPTKDRDLKTLSLKDIEVGVEMFKAVARNKLSLNFLVTRIGCGLAGYKDEQIAPMFKGSPENCFFSAKWARWL
jgi:hypothetical protein